MAVDNTGGSYNGRLYVAWTDFSSNNAIDFAYSTNQGLSWTQRTIQNRSLIPKAEMFLIPTNSKPNPPSSSPLLQSPEPVVGPDGTVYVVYQDLSDYNTLGSSGTIQFAKLTNGGQSLSTPTAIANISGIWSGYVGWLRVSSYPTIAVDPSSGNIYVAYTQYDNGDYNIYYTRSTNNGGNWSSPAIATQSTSSLQFFPWLAVNSSGVVSLTYYQGSSSSVNVYMAESYNAGLSFSGIDTKITSASGNPNAGSWTCDYTGMTSTVSGKTLPFWTDFRSGTTAHVYTTASYYSGGTTNQTLTIPQSETAVFSPGSYTSFNSNTSLIVNGTLVGQGTLTKPITFDFVSPNSTNQNGITFNSGSSGTINYCQIRNAFRGIYENNVVPPINITNSAISGCIDGIYLYGSDPVIQSCNIHNNSDYGISTFWSSANIQTGNYIKYNNNGGIFCSSSSQPVIGNNSTHIGNYISNNSYGVIVFNNANPKIGNGSLGGYNNIDNSTNNILNTTNNTVYAQNNWWNGNSNNVGSVIYIPYLTLAVNISQPPLSKTTGNLAASDTEDVPMLADLNNAYQLAASNNLVDARTICLNLINNYPDYGVSYNALNLLKETYSKNELTAMKDIYSSLFNKKTKKDLYAMAGLILSDIDKENKLKQIDEVIAAYEGEGVVELALFDKFAYYYFEMNDVKNARTISEELDKQFPLSEGAVEAHKILGDKEYYKITPKQNTLQKTVAQTPGEYALLGNYPNPFNPSTTISYSLPYQSSVELTIYDIMGREVKSFNISSQSSGYQNIVWDGTNENSNPVSSGIYLYRISIKSLENSKTFVKTAKLIMLK